MSVLARVFSAWLQSFYNLLSLIPHILHSEILIQQINLIQVHNLRNILQQVRTQAVSPHDRILENQKMLKSFWVFYAI